MSQIPIPPTKPKEQSELQKIVEKIITAKKADPAADVSTLEAEINSLVYKLYDLTPEEIKIVDPALHEATQGKGGGA